MEFNYEMEEGIDHILSEAGNSFISLRKIRWKETSDFKFDIRKYYLTNGEERAAKGISLDEEACNNLPIALLEEGFGDTKEVLNTIKDRDDFNSALSVLSDEQIESVGIDPSTVEKEEYYDPTKDFFDNEEVDGDDK